MYPQSSVGDRLKSILRISFDNGSDRKIAAYQQFQNTHTIVVSVTGTNAGTIVAVNPAFRSADYAILSVSSIGSNTGYAQPGVPVPAGSIARSLKSGGVQLWVLDSTAQGATGIKANYRLETVTFQGTHVVIQALSTDSRQRITLDGTINGMNSGGRLNYQNLQVNNQSGFWRNSRFPPAKVFSCNL